MEIKHFNESHILLYWYFMTAVLAGTLFFHVLTTQLRSVSANITSQKKITKLIARDFLPAKPRLYSTEQKLYTDHSLFKRKYIHRKCFDDARFN